MAAYPLRSSNSAALAERVFGQRLVGGSLVLFGPRRLIRRQAAIGVALGRVVIFAVRRPHAVRRLGFLPGRFQPLARPDLFPDTIELRPLD